MTQLRTASTTLAVLLASAMCHALAQQADVPPTHYVPMAATSATVVPMLVRYDGVAVRGNSAAPATSASITFLIYKDVSGGQPLWIEIQSVAIDAAGRYAAYLGSTYSSGLPPGLFGSGEARWLEVQIAGETPGPRILLTSVPYALKAADAATLGGLPASAFALVGATTSITPVKADSITADAAANVTTLGGTNLYLPKFSGPTTIVNSEIYDSGTSVGIGGVPNASVKLDVNGAMIMRGNMQVTRTGNATTSKGYPSYGFQFYSNAYNSSSKAGDNPYFQLQSEPAGNNTSSPSATFNLLFSNNGSAPAETGLYISPNGTINFASSQTFPATSSSGTAVDGTSGSGTGVQGTSTSGTGAAGSSTSANGVLGYTAGTTLNTAGVYGVAGVGNTSGFGGIAGVWGNANAHVGVFGSSTQYDGVFGDSSAANGVEGASATSYGVLGGTSAASGAAAGVYGYSNTSMPGVKGASAAGNGGDFYGGTYTAVDANAGIGVYGQGGSVSNSEARGGVGGFFVGGTALVTGPDDSGGGVVGEGGDNDLGDGGPGGYFVGGQTDSQSGAPGEGLMVGSGFDAYTSSYGAAAASFRGNVSIDGTLSANAKNFQIDDPRDPANKYLNHTSIESSEMLNLYTGNVTTNGLGIATVALPDWFETVNGDFRYQLTIIGKKAQAWVSHEVEDGKFEITTDTPGVRVSWQVAGVRRDPYAKAHPLVVEQAKDRRERGFYKNPELYGQPREKQTEWGRNPGLMRQMEAMHQRRKSAVKNPVSAVGTQAATASSLSSAN